MPEQPPLCSIFIKSLGLWGNEVRFAGSYHKKGLCSAPKTKIPSFGEGIFVFYIRRCGSFCSDVFTGQRTPGFSRIGFGCF